MPRKASRQRSYTRRRRKRVSRAPPSRAQPQSPPEIKITKKMLKSPKIAIKASSIKVISSSPIQKDDFVKSILKRNTSRRASTKASQFVQKRRSRKQSRVRFSRRNSIRRFYK